MLLLLSLASAELPLPIYPECGEPDRPDLCPPDLREYWPMISYIPAGSRESVRPAELTMGSGQGEDRAWRITTGRWDVMLAVVDSGIDWGAREYQRKIALNTDELPLPQDSDGVEAASYDTDGNGLVNIDDYAQDPRVDITAGRDVGDGQLDASDLIYTFSDGVDGDLNGFTDDIAGWDFFADDNDPYTENESDNGTHGSGVIEEMAAEGNDGDGDIGACPTCSVLPLRHGDSFVTDGHRVALAIVYAVDRGAAVVNMSVGALTRPDFTTDAIAWARAHEVNLVGVTGDENSYHHNQPAAQDGILYVHSIKASNDDENNNVYSYFNFLNCNNFGPRVDFVADTPACATGSAAITSGVLGLMKSAALDLGVDLTADEAVAILRNTVDDVNLSADELAIARTYPSGPGWDPFYGYGRISAWRAVQAVVDGDIPPTAEISSPAWFDNVDPVAGTLDLRGFVRAPRAGSVNWTVEVATGFDAADWRTVASGTGEVEGSFGTLDLSAFPSVEIPEPPEDEGILARLDRVMAPAVTLRITATDGDGRRTEARKTFFVHADPDRLSGFPVQMASSGESSPILADLDGDGVFEILIADSGGQVHALDGSGAELPGWPVETPSSVQLHSDQPATVAGAVPTVRDGIIASVAVGDADGDGEPEVYAASGTGRVYAWNADGTEVDGFPVVIEGREPEAFGPNDSWDNGFAGAPTLYDLDGDGRLEVLAAAMDQRLYVWDADGLPWGPYPVEVCFEGCDSGFRIINSPTVGDVDGDGAVEIGLGTNEAVHGGSDSVSYLFDALTGTLEPGWPLTEGGLVNQAGLLPIVGEGHPGSLAFADLDGDGTLEIASPVMLGQSSLYRADASEYLHLAYVATNYGENNNVTEPSFATMSNQPAFGDMTGDGVPEFVTGGSGTYYLISLALWNLQDYQHVLAAWDGVSGDMLSGFPRQLEDLQFLSAPAIADLTGDGRAEAILGSGGYLVYAWDADGTVAPGWPKFTGNWILGSPAVGDIDGDGYLDVVVSTREGLVYAWKTAGAADQAVQWASIHHDAQNTGNYETPLPAQAGPPVVEVPPEGCCGGGKAQLWFLAPAVGMLMRRRRK